LHDQRPVGTDADEGEPFGDDPGDLLRVRNEYACGLTPFATGGDARASFGLRRGGVEGKRSVAHLRHRIVSRMGEVLDGNQRELPFG
jgi:hypothetical protein